MEPQEEPDWQGIWRRIVADAEQHVEEWRRQAEWLEKAGGLPSADEWHAAQRRASKAFVRHQVQQVELAYAINEGDIAGYIQRWYPTTAPPNGPSVSFITSSEWSLTLTAEISYDEYEEFVNHFAHLDPKAAGSPGPSGNQAAIRRKLFARRSTRRQRQASTPPVKHVPTWQKGDGRVGPGPSLRDWARRVCRRH
jgi:hypothetical protein